MHQLAFCLLPVLLAVAAAQTSMGNTNTAPTASPFSPLETLLFLSGDLRQCLPLLMGLPSLSDNHFTLSTSTERDLLAQCRRLLMTGSQLSSKPGLSVGRNNPLKPFAAKGVDGVPKLF